MKEIAIAIAQPQMRWVAIRVALVIGSILFAINHGSAVVHRKMSRDRWMSAVLTYIVPFCVSIHGQSQGLKHQAVNRDEIAIGATMDVEP
jgi:hypothetical protein